MRPMEPPQTRIIVGFDPPWVVTGLLFIPYLVWGVYLLRQRLDERSDTLPLVEALTLAAVAVFLGLQIHMLRVWMQHTPVQLVLSIIALAVSAVALYGHVAVSLVAHLFVEMMLPSGRHDASEPRYGDAESLERTGDFAGAARAYQAIGAAFPREPRPPLRAGDNLAKLGRYEEAAAEFERANRLLTQPEQSLRVTLRLVEIYTNRLQRPESAQRVLAYYVARHPNAERIDVVRQRLDRLRGDGTDSDVALLPD